MVPSAVGFPDVLGQCDDPCGDMIDRHEVDRRARARRHMPDATLGNQLERRIDRVERANCPARGVSDHDAWPRDREAQATRGNQCLALRLARLIAVCEPGVRQRIIFSDDAVALAANIGGADMKQRGTALASYLYRVCGARNIDRTIVVVLEIEPRRRGAVDQ